MTGRRPSAAGRHIVAGAVLTSILSWGSAGTPASARQSAPALASLALSAHLEMFSPVALASWTTERTQDGADMLRLLVLLRGQPGWFLEPSGPAGSSVQDWSDDAWHHRQVIVQGGRRIELTFDASRNAMTINGQPVDLGTRNVVLVDDVDAPSGLRVAKTMAIGPRMPGSAGQLGLLLKPSAEIVFFLRCDATPANGRGRAMLERLCANNLGLTRQRAREPRTAPGLAWDSSGPGSVTVEAHRIRRHARRRDRHRKDRSVRSERELVDADHAVIAIRLPERATVVDDVPVR
jgi:hypothetical protein